VAQQHRPPGSGEAGQAVLDPRPLPRSPGALKRLTLVIQPARVFWLDAPHGNPRRLAKRCPAPIRNSGRAKAPRALPAADAAHSEEAALAQRLRMRPIRISTVRSVRPIIVAISLLL